MSMTWNNCKDRGREQRSSAGEHSVISSGTSGEHEEVVVSALDECWGHLRCETLVLVVEHDDPAGLVPLDALRTDNWDWAPGFKKPQPLVTNSLITRKMHSHHSIVFENVHMRRALLFHCWKHAISSPSGSYRLQKQKSRIENVEFQYQHG